MIKMDMGASAFQSWRDSVTSEVTAEGAEKHLQRWLEGYSLPRIDNHTEGHGWLLEAVRDVPGLGYTIAKLASKLLRFHVEGRLESSNSARLLFNLFYLCAGLQCPAVLWAPLLDVLKSQSPSKNGPSNYRGIPLSTALRAALTQNQADYTLHKVWRDMLDGKPDPILHGTPMDGFEGILGLPGQPNHDEIGYALACAAVHLSDIQLNEGKPGDLITQLRERHFAELIHTVISRFPEESWDFRSLAILCGWPDWALDSLTGIFSLKEILCHVTYDGLEVELQKNGSMINVRLGARYRHLGSVAEQMVVDFQRCSLPMHHLENAIRPMTKKANA